VTDFLIEQSGYHWDLALDDGDAVLTHTLGRPREVVQRVVFRLLTNLGESPYDLAAGIPWVGGVFGAYPVDGIAGLLVLEMSETEGVDEVISPLFDLGDNSTLAVTAEIRPTGEDDPVGLDLLVGG
jgi:hypothetical protein